MCAIEWKIFDDLLIGNFMKTTLHGNWTKNGLYPDFSPYVAKYADNGEARTKEELQQYFNAYRRRAPLEFLRHQLLLHSMKWIDMPTTFVRSYLPKDSSLYRAMKQTYGVCLER
jgi:hypothetical protein